MIVSAIMAVDTQKYGVFDENASRRFHPPSLRSYGGQVETVILAVMD
jgi:hypothetical protein